MDSDELIDHAGNLRIVTAVDAALQQAWVAVRRPTPTLPWDTNPWLRQVFAPSSGPSLPGLQIWATIPPPLPVLSAVQLAGVDAISSRSGQSLVAANGPAYVRAVRRLKNVSWTEGKLVERDRAIEMWRIILNQSLVSSVTGRQLLEDGATMKSDCSINSTIRDTFQPKSTATLLKRAGSLLRYVKWCISSSVTLVPFPITESTTYQYLMQLRSSLAAASVGTDFRSALAFCQGTIGLDGVDNCLESARCQGVAGDILATKRMLQQRKSLLVDQVISLEKIVKHGVSLVDRCGAGHHLYLTYGRLRWGDGQYTEKISLDAPGGIGFVEAEISWTKTSNTKQKRHRFLSVAAQSHGIWNKTWAADWLQARADANLVASKGKPFMPAPNTTGEGWQDRPLTASEGSAWLQQLLIDSGHSADSVSNIGTHSDKATGLSWAAKWGVDIPTRRLLGYHSDSNDTSVLTYSRDAMAAPLRAFSKVIADISTGRFRPDETRSGMFVEPESPPLAKRRRIDPVLLAPSLAEEFTTLSDNCELCGITIEGEISIQVCTRCGSQGCTECKPLKEMDEWESWCKSCTTRTPDEPQVRSDTDDGFGDTQEPEVLSDFSTDEENEEEDDIGPPEDLEQIQAAAEEIAAAFSHGSVRRPARHEGQFLYRHVKYRTLHWLRAEGNDRLACGKPLHEQYELLEVMPAFQFPKCVFCFGSS